MELIMPAVDERHIRETAYHLWEKDGRPMGQDHRYWELAKKNIVEAKEFPISAPAVNAPPRKKRSAKVGRVQ